MSRGKADASGEAPHGKNPDMHTEYRTRSNTRDRIILRAPTSTATRCARRPGSTVTERATRLVRRSGVAEMITAWAAEDGAPIRTTLTVQSVLTAWVALALDDRRLSVENAADLLSQQPSLMVAIGSPPLRSLRERVRRTTARILDTIDAYPLPVRGRRLRHSEWEQVQQWRAAHAERLETKRNRAVRFLNALLLAQRDELRDAAPAGRVDIAVDALFRPAGVPGISPLRLAQLDPDVRVSTEPDAGFTAQGDVTNQNRVSFRYGWSYQVAVQMPNTPGTTPGNQPCIAIGLNPETKPGQGFGERAAELLDTLGEHGLRVDHLVADRAYSALRPGQWHDQLREHRAKLVTDYGMGRLGLQDTTEGAVLVEGTWYAPAIPNRLVTAASDHRNTVRVLHDLPPDERRARIAEADAQLEAQVAERRQYELRGASRAGLGSRAAGLEQHYPYLTPEWRHAYHAGRNAIEYLAAQVREDDGRHPFAGATGHAFATMLTLLSTNARTIAAWADEH